MMNNIYANCIVGFKLKAKKAKNKFIWRLLYVKFDLENEAQNWPITLTAKFIKDNSTMIASVGLVASLPLCYIEHLERLKLNPKTKTTKWVQPPRQWNLCKKAVVAAARSLQIKTVRTKSLVSFAGIKNHDCEKLWIDPMLIDVTYSILPDAIESSKKYWHSVTSAEEIFDDLSHEPSVMIQIKTLAFVCGYYFIFYGDGARSNLCDNPEADYETDQKLWRNVWVSKNKDLQCSCSSLSNLLHFLGDAVGGNGMYDIKDICHDQQQMTKKYGKIHFSKQRGRLDDEDIGAISWLCCSTTE